jgi:cytosine deaminase
MRLTHARLADSTELVDLCVADGVITGVEPAGPGPGDLDLAGRLVLPGRIETHLDLDKAHLDSLEPNPDGTLAGASLSPAASRSASPMTAWPSGPVGSSTRRSPTEPP